MNTSFAAMKKARSNSFDKLNSQLQKLSTPNNNQNDDDGLLKPPPQSSSLPPQ